VGFSVDMGAHGIEMLEPASGSNHRPAVYELTVFQYSNRSLGMQNKASAADRTRRRNYRQLG